jgi:hypothetical protein
LFDLFFDPEDRCDMFLRNVGFILKDYTALYPMIELFINTAVRTSNPAIKKYL